MSKSFFDYFPAPKLLQMPAVGLDISSRAVRMIELQKDGATMYPVRYGERELKTPVGNSEELVANDELKKALQSLQREFNLQFVKVTLPEDEAYLFTTQLDEGTHEEMRAAIELHLEENVPLSGEECVFDFHRFQKTEDGKVGVAVTVLPEKTVNAFIELLESCNLIPISFLLQPTATSRALIPKGDKGTYILATISETKTNLSIISEDAIRFSSTVTVGSDSFNEAIMKQFSVPKEEAEKMKWTDGLIKRDENKDLFFALANNTSVLKEEIDRLYLYWHSHKEKEGVSSKKVDKIILTGKDAAIPGLKDHIASSVRVPVEVGNVWQNAFSIDDVIPTISKIDSLNYGAAIGLNLPKYT